MVFFSKIFQNSSSSSSNGTFAKIRLGIPLQKNVWFLQNTFWSSVTSLQYYKYIQSISFLLLNLNFLLIISFGHFVFLKPMISFLYIKFNTIKIDWKHWEMAGQRRDWLRNWNWWEKRKRRININQNLLNRILLCWF